MKTAIYTHKDCLKHDTGPNHPECQERLTEIIGALNASNFRDQLEIIDAPLGTEEQVLLAHSQKLLDYIKYSSPSTNPFYIDGDTILSYGTLNAALHAVGAGCTAIDDVIKGKYKTAFCAIRPPGHHAKRNQSMGFCIFNNIAISALYALDKHNLKRIAIIDFDVHHGNGTQNIIGTEKRVFYISTHQSPLFPGTGFREDKGVSNLLNIPLSAETTGTKYRTVFINEILPALDNFKPEILLVSAGFDAHKDETLASLKLDESDYAWIGQQLLEIANKHCHGRIISFLEGGYNLDVLGKCVVAYLGSMVG